MSPLRLSLLALLGALACARPSDPPPGPEPAAVPPPAPEPPPPVGRPTMDPVPVERPDIVIQADSALVSPPPPAARPVAPPADAFARGWMPLRSTGVVAFRQAHPEYDGRGVLIGILDSGIDAGIPGLETTSAGERKILDLRDFSHEGRVDLQPIEPRGDTVTAGGKRVVGLARVRGIATGAIYAGAVHELPLGEPPAADLDGDGTVGDTLVVVVARASDGWVLFADTDGDGTLGDERPVRDYLVARETFGWSTGGAGTPLTVAVNFSGDGASPTLDLFFDTSGHGSHVAGIAAANDMYGVSGFDGVAPGAQLLGLKISNNAQGGVSTTGSMLRAIDYAIRFAAVRRLPLVLNMSFGVGNEIEGRARIDAIIDSVLAAHPELVFTISAGNDGPGLSTLGFPGSARRSITVGATIPGLFLPNAPSAAPPPDQVAYFSSRGGELAKPDLVTPGMAYSTVPRWNTGSEINQGTSMASPHAAGLAALLVSAHVAEGRAVEARAIRQALMVTAQPTAGATFLDEGVGVPDVGRAYTWLQRNRTVPPIEVRALDGAHVTSAAYREQGLRGPGDTIQVFEVERQTAAPAAYRLRSDAPWLRAPASVNLQGRTGRISLRYDANALRAPGVYVGVVTGWTEDTTLGPVFRLVNTVIVPAAPRTGAALAGAELRPGGLQRVFVPADTARPFAVSISTTNQFQQVLAFLHEPDGMPFREESGLPAGTGQSAAVYRVDGRDVVSGTYEVVAVAAPTQGAVVTVNVERSPLLIHGAREADGVAVRLANSDSAPVSAEVGVLLGGGERTETIQAHGSATRRIPFRVPAWAKGVVVDVRMAREQWGRFTDFGVTLFDSAGQIMGKAPLNYALGRLQVPLPDDHGGLAVELGLFPGFANPDPDEPWTVDATIRLYADSAVALPVMGDSATQQVTVGPRGAEQVRFGLIPSPWPLPEGFYPLAVIVARTGGFPWTRELGLPAPRARGGR